MLHDILLKDNDRQRTIAKGTVIQFPGDPVTRGYLVVKGCLRSYVIDAGGKEHVLQFAPENWVLGDMKAAIRKLPATLYMDALEESVVVELDMGIMDTAGALAPELVNEVLATMRRNIVALNDRIVDLMAATGEERYLRFMATYPGLFQRLPQKLIASYLGLTPESLSRIRNGIAKGGSGKHSGM